MLSLTLIALGAGVVTRRSELLPQAEVEALGVRWRHNASDSHDHLPVPDGGFPDEFTWCDKDGVNFCTISLNQHIPQYVSRPLSKRSWRHTVAPRPDAMSSLHTQGIVARAGPTAQRPPSRTASRSRARRSTLT